MMFSYLFFLSQFEKRAKVQTTVEHVAADILNLD